jgi:Ran GTPase-activating protein (RanGAP) involved in mRNA processing and transport
VRGNNMGDVGAQALLKTISKNARLTKLDVSDNGIGEPGGGALGQLLSAAKALKQADLSWNNVRVAGALSISEGLKSSSLVRLNLAWNGLGERGAAAIGGALKENATLQFLDLSSNTIGRGNGIGPVHLEASEGTQAIAEGLRDNTTLRSLQLSGNPIGDKGVVMVIEAVGINLSVRDLGLVFDWDLRQAAGRLGLGGRKDEV